MGDYMQEAGVLIQRLCSAVNDGRTRDAISIQYALLAHIERGRVPEGEPAAWAHCEDPFRVISALQKETAVRDGGACASSVANYSVPLFAAAPAAPTSVEASE